MRFDKLEMKQHLTAFSNDYKWENDLTPIVKAEESKAFHPTWKLT